MRDDALFRVTENKKTLTKFVQYESILQINTDIIMKITRIIKIAKINNRKLNFFSK